MHYPSFEASRAFLQPTRVAALLTHHAIRQLPQPLSDSPQAKFLAAGCQIAEDWTRRYTKPLWTIDLADGPVAEPHAVLRKPFANLLHFQRPGQASNSADPLPKVLLIAPLSGHYATLLRDTVSTLLEHHDVYVTDWADARMVPWWAGSFDLNSYIDYLIEFIQHLGTDTHVIAVCQPTVPALAATALLAEDQDACQPTTLTLMAGPVDTRVNPTLVNEHATTHDLAWFRHNTISQVPLNYTGAMRSVYPGYMQLAGFMSMNLDRHASANRDYFEHLVQGNFDQADRHRDFYDEYLSVMDLTAEFFLQTVDEVFQQHSLPTGTMTHRGRLVDCSLIKDTRLLTVEAGRDDICGIGQTEAAHALCSSLRDDQRDHYLQDNVGHYGVFNGKHWRDSIEPRIRAMIASG